MVIAKTEKTDIAKYNVGDYFYMAAQLCFS